MNIFEYLKSIFANQYGCKKAAGLKPHITMGSWLYSEYREVRIITNIKRFAETVNPFIAQFDGLGKFEPKTIFADVLNKEPFTEISQGLRNSTRNVNKMSPINYRAHSLDQTGFKPSNLNNIRKTRSYIDIHLS